MRILILTHGSRGDVEPFAALSRGLVKSGHEVTIGAPREWRSIVEPNATKSVLFPDRLHEAAEDPRIREGVSNNFRGLRGKRNLIARIGVVRRARIGILRDFEAIVDKDFDILVYHGLLPGGRIAKKLGIPAVPVGLAPGYLPSRSYPFIALPFPVPRMLNRSSYLWMNTRNILLLMPRQNAGIFAPLNTKLLVRKNSKIGSGDRASMVGLQCYSSHVWPPKFDRDAGLFTSGYWFLPKSRTWQPTQEVKEFINRGSPPVYIGFGSVVGNSEWVTRTIVEGVKIAGVRAVVGAGWENFHIPDSEHFFVLDDAPFEWLFPRVSVVVHHGGIGTIGAALRSGRPQVIFPAHRATKFYAHAVHRCGVGYFPRQYSELSASNLAGAIQAAVANSSMRARANEVGEKVRFEDGVENAVRIIEKLCTE